MAGLEGRAVDTGLVGVCIRDCFTGLKDDERMEFFSGFSDDGFTVELFIEDFVGSFLLFCLTDFDVSVEA